MATSYEKINSIKSKLKVKQTVKSLAHLMGCGPRTIFRHLEVIAEENCGLRKFKENGETYYQLRYTAKVKEELPFNPTHETNERAFVDLDDLINYITWSNGIAFSAQIESAKKVWDI